jgi:PEGA domain
MAFLRILLLALVVIGVSGRPAAAADTSKVDDGLDEQLSEGIALRRAGKDDAALGVFLGLEKRAPDSVRVLLHITTAALAAGRWTMAYDYMQRASAHKDEPYYQRYKSAIENVERVISQRIGQFRVQGSPVGAEVRLSGALVGTLPMADAKAVEVGSYMLEVSKPGYFALRRPVTIAGDGGLTQEDITLGEQKPFSASPALGQMAAQGDVPADSTPALPGAWWQSRSITWTLLGVGIAAGATSGAAFVVREIDAAHWNDNSSCLDPGSAGTTRQQKCTGVHRDIETAQTVGIATGIAAVALGGAALAHWLATPSRPASDRAHAKVDCAPGLASVVCSGSF